LSPLSTPRRLLALACGLVVFELLARARMFEGPCYSVEVVVQRPSTAGEAGQRELSEMHVEKSYHHAIRGHQRCSAAQRTSFRTVYKENISELRRTGRVSSKDVTHRSRDLWHRIRAMCELSVLCHKRKVQREERQREEMSKKEMSRGISLTYRCASNSKRMKEEGGECNEARYL